MQRRKFLTLKAPSQPVTRSKIEQPGLTAEQNQVFNEMLNAEDYYLLWGPPGTGKTSVMLRSFVQHLMRQSKEVILLLAYTNRAVDEMCRAIESIGEPPVDYVRIGSRYSTDPRHRSHLLNEKIADVNTRAELKEVIRSHRIVVGTVSPRSAPASRPRRRLRS